MLKQTQLRAFVLAASAVAGLAACGGGTTFGTSEKEKAPEKGKQPAPADDSEDSKALTPTQVSGSFLTCDYTDESMPEQVADTSGMGCAVRDKNRKKMDCDVNVDLLDAGGAKVAMRTWKAPSASEWNTLLALPNPYRNVGKLKVDWKCEKGGSGKKDVQLSLLGDQMEESDGTDGSDDGLGTSAKNDPDPLPDLRSFTAARYWDGGAKGFALNGIKRGDFCTSDGTIRDSFEWDSSLYATLGNILLPSDPVPTTTVATPTEVTSETSKCFEKFGVLKGTKAEDKQFAQDGGNGKCLFVRQKSSGNSKDDRLLIMTADPSKNLTLESLRKFVQTKACN